MDTANILTRFGNAQALASAGMGTPAAPPAAPADPASIVARAMF